MKYLLVIAVVGLVLWLLLRARGAVGPRAGKPAKPVKPRNEAMVACAHCGVHLPLSEAVADGTHVFCSDPHRLAGPRQRG